VSDRPLDLFGGAVGTLLHLRNVTTGV